MVSCNGHHQFNSWIPECLPSFEVGYPMASQTTVARHASFLAFLHLARSVENLALILTDGLPNSAEIFTFLLAFTAWWRGYDDVPNKYVIVVSKTKLAGNMIIQNTRHEITRWWRPPASTGKILTYYGLTGGLTSGAFCYAGPRGCTDWVSVWFTVSPENAKTFAFLSIL